MLSTFARTTTLGRMLKAKFYKVELKAPLKSTNMRSYITEGYLNFVWYRQVRSCVLCRSNFFSWICTASIVLHLHFPRIRLVPLHVDTRKFTSSVFSRPRGKWQLTWVAFVYENDQSIASFPWVKALKRLSLRGRYLGPAFHIRLLLAFTTWH